MSEWMVMTTYLENGEPMSVTLPDGLCSRPVIRTYPMREHADADVWAEDLSSWTRHAPPVVVPVAEYERQRLAWTVAQEMING